MFELIMRGFGENEALK